MDRWAVTYAAFFSYMIQRTGQQTNFALCTHVFAATSSLLCPLLTCPLMSALIACVVIVCCPFLLQRLPPTLAAGVRPAIVLHHPLLVVHLLCHLLPVQQYCHWQFTVISFSLHHLLLLSHPPPALAIASTRKLSPPMLLQPPSHQQTKMSILTKNPMMFVAAIVLEATSYHLANTPVLAEW